MAYSTYLTPENRNEILEEKKLTDVHKIPSLSEINPILPNLSEPG